MGDLDRVGFSALENVADSLDGMEILARPRVC